MLAHVLDFIAPSLREIAREAGISYGAIRHYRKAKRTPAPAVIQRLVKVLRARGGKLQQLADQLERQIGER
jgi:AcrR family transcriptional regulator